MGLPSEKSEIQHRREDSKVFIDCGLRSVLEYFRVFSDKIYGSTAPGMTITVYRKEVVGR